MIMISRRLMTSVAAVVAVGSIAALTSTPAHAGTVTTKKIAGIQTSISCISSKLCVAAGYNSKSIADLTPVVNGTPKKASLIKQSDRINAITCTKTGCVALGDLSNGDLLVVSTTKKGKPGKAHDVKVPFGVAIASLSCTKPTACIVAGANSFATKPTLEAGTWNGNKLSLHKAKAPKGATASVGVTGISCKGKSCTAVGLAGDGDGFTFPIKNGKPGKVAIHKGDDLTGIACSSASLCYVAGSTATSGFVATAHNGKFTSKADFDPFPSAIACAGKNCVAAGQQNTPSGSAQPFDGALISVVNGKLVNSSSVSQSQGYTDIALPKPGKFVAVGEGGSGEGSFVVSSN